MPILNPRQFGIGELPGVPPQALENFNAIVQAIDDLLKRRRDDPDSRQPSMGMFPVYLEEVSGSAGDCTTPCNYLYDVFFLTGETKILEAVAPEWRPQSIGSLTSGDGKIGMAYVNSSRNATLYMAGESILCSCLCADSPCSVCDGPQEDVTINCDGCDPFSGGDGLYVFTAKYDSGFYVCTWAWDFNSGSNGFYLKYCYNSGIDAQSGQAVVVGNWYIFYLTPSAAFWKQTNGFICADGTITGTDSLTTADLLSGVAPADPITITL